MVRRARRNQAQSKRKGGAGYCGRKGGKRRTCRGDKAWAFAQVKTEVDNLPESNIGTELHQKEIHYSSDGSKREQSRVIKLRDLVASLKDLIDGDFRREKLDLDKKRAEDDW